MAYFIFFYPIIMSIVWIIGGLYFWARRERKQTQKPESNINYPPITILVPCYNEENTIANLCTRLTKLKYPDYHVIFIDDASTDSTADIIRKFVYKTNNFHLLRLTQNSGKANALNYALFNFVNTPITVIIDADTIIVENSLYEIVKPFLFQPRLGAVTGNPIVMNKEYFLEKLQAAEFASIISLIKRSQRVISRVLTVSGCFAAYNTKVLKEIGGFSPFTATEDIDITWRIQKHFYEVWFVPQAIAYIQVPSNLKEFFKQRRRWALGGWQLLRIHKDVFTSWKYRRLWLIYLEFMLSCVWGISFVIGSIIWLINFIFHTDFYFFVSPFPQWYGSIISLVCITQFIVAIFVNHQYDKKLWKELFWIPWYPLFFFCFGALSIVATLPKGLFGSMEKAGIWKSPERKKINVSI
ncbi:glycosyltransferase [Carboxydothermus ferrireducens]|uniref:Biofilm PGA synthesis N-glycosyltransferase PgaC n=2 Tax=Carboxydothermus TaxID=129957 RepID=A0ABX2RA38_9THEO|nr:glycosyltransferase family 2 protein [Carboxydothermus ferrireducens]NYE56727.1 biofilm PGA synthesis N-glycosyltransferase PgaC [Carboxydothermus ferrireducens DSM 11255]